MFRPSTKDASLHRSSSLGATPARAAPLSPPETELDQHPLVVNESLASDVQQVHSETPAQRFRRLAYNTGSPLSQREQRAPQRQTKWLIMVVPPSSLNEPPVLGHTLSSAPTGRFSHGILMPLFPTLYGQLTAIAREFNMPSTTGLCIYLQIQESGVPTMTPRVSDETWQILWTHCFSGENSTTSHGLPIAGRIEFDIDFRRAKWFNTWMGLAARTESEAPLSREPSLVHSHWRGESRSSLFVPEQVQTRKDESPSPPEATPTANQPFRSASQRQVPRPLLLERRDASSSRSLSRHQSRGQNLSVDILTVEPPAAAQSSTTDPTFVPNALSPMVQELEEPPTAKPAKNHDLDSLVKKWRQSSVTGGPTSAVSAAGQPSLDAVNMPPGADVELDLDDFTWSISSAGPPSESPMSPNWPSPLPSIHLLDRMAGSVCLTPTTCTSWGPPSYPQSPVSYASRRPSIDLGQRMEEFVPLTPSTATSWGPEDLPSPLDYQEISRPPSVDLGMRNTGSVPVTPSTATSWGPEDLPSPLYYQEVFRPPSVDIGLRGMGSVPATPSTATSWGPPDTPLFIPPTPDYVRSPDAGERSFLDFQVSLQSVPNLSFPYYDAWATQPWAHVWPYQSRMYPQHQETVLGQTPIRGTVHQPTAEYPDFAGLYPPSEIFGMEIQLHGSSGYPAFELYPAVYPYNLQTIYPVVGLSTAEMDNVGRVAAVDVALLSAYPVLEIYSAVYPFNLHNIYPAISVEPVFSPKAPSRDRLPEYPDFANLYPADPKAELVGANKRQPVCEPYAYPFIVIYPLVYPFSLVAIYPPTVQAQRSFTYSQTKKLLPEYPDFAALYPADKTTELAGQVKAQPVTLQGQAYEYPGLLIYPAVYPYNMDSIYPPVDHSRSVASAVQQSVYTKKDTTPLLSFPYYDPWTTKPWMHVWPYQDPPVRPWSHVWPYQSDALPSSDDALSLDYPDFAGLYPASPLGERIGENKAQSVSLPQLGYPFINVYESVYPYNVYEIYSPSKLSLQESKKISVTSKSGLLLDYPDFAGLYPEDPLMERVAMNKAQPVALPELSYPFINVYPSVYPHSVYDIYGSSNLLVELSPRENEEIPATSKSGLLPEYPDFAGLYPEDLLMERVGMNKARPVTLPELGYPFINVYSAVYPHSVYEIYGVPCTVDSVTMPHQTKVTVTSRKDYLPEYPDFCGLYPEDPRTERVGMNKAQPAALPDYGYPNLVLYPSAYPYSIYEIYGPSSLDVPPRKGSHTGIDVKLSVYQGYPVFNLYPVPSGYPTFEIYPPIAVAECFSSVGPISVKLPSRYPAIQIYESVYPHLVIYPSVLPPYKEVRISLKEDILPCLYPTIQIYKPVYPHFDLYPAAEVTMAQRNSKLSTKLPAPYPAIEIYESVYPHLVIYPSVILDDLLQRSPSKRRRAPTPVPGRHRQPSFTARPQGLTEERTSRSPVQRPVIPPLPDRRPSIPEVNEGQKAPWKIEHSYQPRRKPKHTHHDLHKMVFGEEDVQERPAYLPRRKPKRTHHELHMMVFGSQIQGEFKVQNVLQERSQPVYMPRRQPRRTHHELHLMVFGSQSEQDIKETLAKFPLPPPPSIPLPPTPPTPPAVRIRGRSGTVSQRPTTAYESLRPLSTLNELAPGPSRPSPSGSRQIPSPFTNSPSRSAGSSTRGSPISPAESSSPSSPSKVRPTSVKGLPYSPAQTRVSVVGLPSSPSANLLTRVRSMNRERSTTVSPVSPEGGALDRSRSMSEATMRARRSIVQDRARLFSGGELPASNNEDETPKLPSRPISKLDRSKIPFS